MNNKVAKIREIAIKKGYANEIDEALNEYFLMNGSYEDITELHIINTCISIALREQEEDKF